MPNSTNFTLFQPLLKAVSRFFFLILLSNFINSSYSQSSSRLKINFQDQETLTPAGWLSDFGQPFAPRTSVNQGSGNTYGWINQSDKSPLDLSSYGRNRTSPSDTLLATLMHMQFNTASEGIWEAQVENGNYDVTISVGDGAFLDSRHYINVEGVPAIIDFVPTSGNRFKNTTVSVTVTDGKISVDAMGGTNTKINFVIIEPTVSRFKVNFQDQATPTPVGWFADFGQSYGSRTSANQGSGNNYGWIKQSDRSPLDLTAYGRKRTTPADTLLATFMHMQFNASLEGIWEAQVANGTYEVTVSAGDGSYLDSRHTITVEGVPAIVDFVPTSANRFKYETITVTVTDGKLTVDALGGSNTKINYISFHSDESPLPPSKSISFVQPLQTADVEQGGTQDLLEYISTSDNNVITVNLNAVDENGTVPTWLNVNNKLLNGITYTTGSEITFKFDATNLSIGKYTATVTASASGYSSAILNIELTVKSGSTGTQSSLKINFQDQASVTPVGWLTDFGQAFGTRTSPNQGTGNTFGWINTTDNSPLDLTLYGRKRTSPSDTLLATLMHMQAKGAPEGKWEAQVANGNYDVTVSVGDGDFLDSKHYINVEGVPAIIAFVPTTSMRFRNVTVSVTVADGLLTLDAVGGTNTKINYISIVPSTSPRPSVVMVNPENGSQFVSNTTSISTSILNLPNGGINNATLNSASVYLEEEITKTKVPANVNGTGGGDAITLVPHSPLNLSTTYNFYITDSVKDLSGASFIPYSSSFTTSSVSTGQLENVKFNKVKLTNITGRHSTLTFGPDGKLYALSIDGLIKRFEINEDGTLGVGELIYSLQDAYGSRQSRLAIGLAFHPSSTASNLIAYVSHNSFKFFNAPDWDGKLTRLSGANLQQVQDVLINLPRSSKDHLTNSLAFGPDGALYFTQGSNSAMGRADNTWNLRDERLLSAAVLRLDLTRLGTLPLNVQTTDGGGTYNPYAANVPLTIYASGLRNAYDLVWHSNGELYVPTNGSAAGGNTPASVQGTLRPDGTTYNGPEVPALTNVQQTQKDFLFRVKKGGYYGHPNPTRGEYVMNGGNPSSSIDPAQVDAYPIGTLPDANWRGFSFDFQNNKSPNGIIEYKNNAFNGALKGKILVVRYSQNDDIITLTPGVDTKDIVSYNEGATIQGFSGFVDPLDLIEDVRNGNIYVSEYGGEGGISLLRPESGVTSPSNAITVSPVKIYDNEVSGGSAGINRTITIKNNSSNTSLSVTGISLTGTNANQFILGNLPVFPKSIAALDSTTFTVAFNPSTIGLKTALININSNDLEKPTVSVKLRGLGTSGTGGTNEPSLQALFNLYEIPVATGDDDANTNVINSNTTLQKADLLGEEVSVQKFTKAGSGAVTIEPLAVFGPTSNNPILGLGWYQSGNINSKVELFTVSNNPVSNGQTVNVNLNGVLSFNPEASSFGFYSRWPFFDNRHLYSEDSLNTFSGSIPHHVRVYPYKDQNGVVPFTYIVAFEEHTSGFDYQDVVFIVRNVKPFSEASSDITAIPFYLDLNNGVAGTIADKNNAGTGFTHVDPYSGTRLSQDGVASNPDIPAYEPSQITLTNGQLQLLTNKGIAFLTNNNQINTLGVKINSQVKLQIETSLVNPFNGSSSQQAGLWFGLNDKTFLKLVATGNKIELRKETNDASSTLSGTSNPDQRITGTISGLDGKTVRLRLVIDPVTNTAEGFYSIDGGVTYVNAGAAYTTPSLPISGMELTSGTAFTGIFATHRNSSTAVTYSFDDFSIVSPTTGGSNAPVFSSQTYNFSVADNVAIGTIIGTASATDADGDAINYEITAGNTNEVFSINSTTGTIQVAKTSYNSQNQYTLTVKASDAGGLFSTTSVIINVSSGNDQSLISIISWGTAASQPFNVYEGQGEVVNGKLYTFGGFDSQKSCCTPTDRAYVYDPAANTWTPIANMPAMNGTTYGGVTHAGFATDGVNIYFAGGYTSNSTGTGQIFGTREVWKYIVAEDRYERLPNLPVTISAGQLEFLNGRLHHIAGTNSSRTTDLDLHYVLTLNDLNGGWKTLAPLPNPRHHAGSAVYNGKIYYIGGQKGHDGSLVTQKDVHQYDPATNTWTKMADLPVPEGASGLGHISSSVVVAAKQIIVIGGETKHGTSTNMVSGYNPENNTWSTLSPLLVNRFSGVAAILGNNIYYTGGSNSKNTYKGIPHVQQVTTFTLMNADTDQPIQTLTNNSTIDLALLPTKNLNIRANSNSSSGSVLFNLTGAETRNFTDNAVPYALYGDNNGDFNPWTPKVGSYTLKATPYTSLDGSGTAGTSLTLNFKVVSEGQHVISYTLINADTEQPIQTFTGDTIINLATLPTRNINIKANTKPETVGSVVFNLTGGEDRIFSDNTAPYALFEDNRGDYYDWNPAVGSYTLKATPFTATGGTGTEGVSLSVNIEIINNHEREVVDFTLINADTEQPVQTLSGGSVLNLNSLPTTRLNIRANTLPGTIGSVVYNLSGAETRTFTDNVVPYALFGDTNGDYNAWTPKVGHYILKATPYSESNGSGTAGPSYTIAFSVTASSIISDVTISPIADAFIRDGSNASTNFGHDTTLIVRGTTTSGNVRSVYMKFPLNSISDVVTAKLRIYGRNTENSTSINTSIFGIDNDSWTETGITWNNAPAALPGAIATFGVNNQQRYFEVDVTDFVKAQFNKDKIVSLLIKDAANQNRTLSFNSRENIFNQPQLIVSTSATAPPSGAQLFVENLDKFPSNNVFVASRIQVPWSRDKIVYNTNHDTLRVRIHNKGMNPLVVSSIALSNKINWKIISLKGTAFDPTIVFPMSIAPGTFADMQVKFIPPDSVIRVRFILDEISVVSNDDKQPIKTLYLRGLFQREGEGSKEPRAQEMINMFGFKSKTGFTSTDPDKGSASKPKGDEVISSYYVRVDPSKPITARQMGAYHGCCNQSETLQWHPKGNTSSLSTAVSHVAEDGQRLLTRRNRNAVYAPSEGSFNPTVPFGFKVGSKDWTDTLLTPNNLIGIRVWKAIDASGYVIPNAYIIANDYLGSEFTNYDYNDNMYYVTNIRPEFGPASTSTLTSTPSAVDFSEKLLSSTNTFNLDIKSLGQVYANGSQDPAINISSVSVVGENSSEFTASMPAKTTLSPQESTNLTIGFNPVSEGLKIADLLIYYNNAGSPLRVPLYGIAKASSTTVTVPYRINSGSSSDVTVNGKTWVSDVPYAFDNLEPYTNSLLTQISATDEDVIYLREQSSNGDKKPFRYEMPISNGNYVVRLHFAEIYWGAPGAGLTGGAGSRVMSVQLENELKLINLDVAQEIGSASAVIKNIPVTVSDGKLNINFSASTNRPMVCAVEVYKFSAGSLTTSSPDNPLLLDQQGPVIYSKPTVYPNPLHNKFTIQFPYLDLGTIQLQLIDVAGRVYNIGKSNQRKLGTTMDVDISGLNLKTGVYILRINSANNKSESIKLLIQ